MKKYFVFLFCTIAIYIFNLSESTAEYSWKKMNGYYEHDFSLEEAQVSPDGKYIYATQPNNFNTIFKIDLETGNLIDSIKIQSKVDTTGLTLRYLTFSRNGKFAILTTYLKNKQYQKVYLPFCEVFEISTHKIVISVNIAERISINKFYPNGYFNILGNDYIGYNNIYTDYIDNSNLFIFSACTLSDENWEYGTVNNYDGLTYFYNINGFKENFINCFIDEMYLIDNENVALMSFHQFKNIYQAKNPAGNYWIPYGGYKVFSFNSNSIIDSLKLSFNDDMNNDSALKNNRFFLNMIYNQKSKKLVYQNTYNSIYLNSYPDMKGYNNAALNFNTKILDMDFIDTNKLFIINQLNTFPGRTATIYQIDSEKNQYEIPIFKSSFDDKSIIKINSNFVLIKSKVWYYEGSNSYYKFKIFKINLDSANQGICSYFISNTSQIMQYDTVKFMNKSSGPISKFFWDFGDGETINEVNPKHIYKKYGTFSVKLIAYSVQDSVSFERTDYIKVNPLLKADFDIKKLTGIDTLALQVINKSIGNIKSYKWYFDNFTSQEKEPTIVLRKPGSYDVTLIVSDGVFSDTLTKKDYLTITQSIPSGDYIDKYYYFSDDSLDIKCTNVKEYNDKIFLISFTPNSDSGKYNYYQLNNNFEMEKKLSFPQNESVLFFDFEVKNENEIYGISHVNLQKFDYSIYKYYSNKVKYLNISTNTFSNYFAESNNIDYTFTQLFKYTDEIYILYNYHSTNSGGRKIISNINKLGSDLNLNDKQIFNQVEVYVLKYFNELLFFKNPFAYRIFLQENYFPGYYNSDIELSLIISSYNFVNDSLFSITYKKDLGNLSLFSDHSKPAKDYDLVNMFEYYDISDNILIGTNKMVTLGLSKSLYYFRLDTFKSQIFTQKDISFASIYNYNDSLFLAGGSYQGKSALFFISTNTDSLQIKDKIVFQSFYGNITAITQTKDNEYFLVVENKKTHNYENDTIPLKGIVESNKKNNKSYLQNSTSDGFVLLKTKNLGKNSNSVSYSPDFKQISNYVSDEILQIQLDKELTENSTLEIYNSIGQRIITEYNLNNYQRNQILKIDLLNYPNQLKGNSVYFYVLKNGSSFQTGKFLLK